jgi:hypothetical protein
VLNLDTHILIYAFSEDLTSREEKLRIFPAMEHLRHRALGIG